MVKAISITRAMFVADPALCPNLKLVGTATVPEPTRTQERRARIVAALVRFGRVRIVVARV
jgi:hypothetical protein